MQRSMNSLIIIALMVVGFILIIKLVHNVIKLALSLIALVIISSLFFGFFVMKDRNDFRDEMVERRILLVQGDDITAGFDIAGQEVTYPSLGNMSTYLEAGDLESMAGGRTFLLIFSEEAFDERFPSSRKSQFFSSLYAERFEEGGYAYLKSELRAGNLKVYPQGPYMTAMRWLPFFS